MEQIRPGELLNTYEVSETAEIKAPAEQVYSLIADYHAGHPAILPVRYFTRLQVEKGGRGEGTVVSVAMRVFGAKFLYRLEVTEPEPGRLLREEDVEAGVVTTFTVDPLDGGSRARVTIATVFRTSPGLRGWIEKKLNPAITRRIYREELAELNRIAQG